MLPRLAHGFSEQRGAIFGFGPKKDEDTGTLRSRCCHRQGKEMQTEKYSSTQFE